MSISHHFWNVPELLDTEMGLSRPSLWKFAVEQRRLVTRARCSVGTVGGALWTEDMGGRSSWPSQANCAVSPCTAARSRSGSLVPCSAQQCTLTPRPQGEPGRALPPLPRGHVPPAEDPSTLLLGPRVSAPSPHRPCRSVTLTGTPTLSMSETPYVFSGAPTGQGPSVQNQNQKRTEAKRNCGAGCWFVGGCRHPVGCSRETASAWTETATWRSTGGGRVWAEDRAACSHPVWYCCVAHVQ